MTAGVDHEPDAVGSSHELAMLRAAELYYYGACAERQLGDRAAEDSYAQQLKSRYADSPLNARLQKGACE